jgi:hypothetical protein
MKVRVRVRVRVRVKVLDAMIGSALGEYLFIPCEPSDIQK